MSGHLKEEEERRRAKFSHECAFSFPHQTALKGIRERKQAKAKEAKLQAFVPFPVEIEPANHPSTWPYESHLFGCYQGGWPGWLESHRLSVCLSSAGWAYAITPDFLMLLLRPSLALQTCHCRRTPCSLWAGCNAKSIIMESQSWVMEDPEFQVSLCGLHEILSQTDIKSWSCRHQMKTPNQICSDSCFAWRSLFIKCVLLRWQHTSMNLSASGI